MKTQVLSFLLLGANMLGSNEGFSATNESLLSKIQTDELKWESNPSLPEDIKVAVLYGDPTKEGTLVLRLKIPADQKIPPHWHSIAENVTVLSGSLNLGTGDKLDQQNGIHLPVGSFVHIPPRHHHSAWFTEETVLQLNNFGRWQIFYVNPKDDPRKKNQHPK